MPRPKIKRSVHRPPLFSSFKPMGIRGRHLPVTELALDEFEAIRLADYESKDHAESAELMGVSRSTFSRLVDKARNKLARFIVDGHRLQIEGGDVHFQGNRFKCTDCGHVFKANLDEEIPHCLQCQSPNLNDLAGGFGHGRCCGQHHGRGGQGGRGQGGRGKGGRSGRRGSGRNGPGGPGGPGGQCST